MFATIATIIVVSILIYKLFGGKPHNFPPGPTPLPIIGNVLSLGPKKYITFREMSKKYGPIVGVKLGPKTAICLHGAKLIKDTFGASAFSGRPTVGGQGSFVRGDNGILGSSGETWTEQRRFAVRHLRDFGFGKSSMEELIMDEVKEFSDWLKWQNGHPVTLHDRFQLAVVNSIWKILSGERYPHDDPKLHKILDDLQKAAASTVGAVTPKSFLISLFPSLGSAFPNWSGRNKLIASKANRLALFTRIVEEHKDTVQEESPRDFVDVYLNEIRKTTNPTSSFHPKIGENSLQSVMGDLFLAGTDTTAVTLSWLNLYLLHNPRAQKKMHAELDRVVGRTRAVSLSDRKSLVYTEAVILETLRLSSIAPLSVPHATTEDVKLQGYDIPQNTLVFANFHATHHDPEIWGEDVEEFRPERFLSPDESAVVKHEALLAFSVGRRVCLGETMARDTLFLFAANLALNFDVTVGPGMEKPLLETKIGHITLAPVNSTVVMKERKM